MLSDSVGAESCWVIRKPGNKNIFKRKMYHGNEAIHIINHMEGWGDGKVEIELYNIQVEADAVNGILASNERRKIYKTVSV